MGHKTPEGPISGKWDAELAAYAKWKFDNETDPEEKEKIRIQAQKIISKIPGMGFERALGLLMMLVIHYENTGRYKNAKI